MLAERYTKPHDRLYPHERCLLPVACGVPGGLCVSCIPWHPSSTVATLLIQQVTLEQQLGVAASHESDGVQRGIARRSTVTFVDLAGSERLSRTGGHEDLVTRKQGIEVSYFTTDGYCPIIISLAIVNRHV